MHLSCPVRRVRWDGPGVAVETDRGELAARAAIVTVSTGVLAFEGVRFTPALPERHLTVVYDLPMGLPFTPRGELVMGPLSRAWWA